MNKRNLKKKEKVSVSALRFGSNYFPWFSLGLSYSLILFAGKAAQNIF
jgi:hypothetical protein